jgi:phosphohistidine swiveling domain-containing protein
MDSEIPWVVPLFRAAALGDAVVGGKACKLAQLASSGFRVPDGFCITVRAYERFLFGNRLDKIIAAELGRKPFESMRWEEIWDSALRIRSMFTGEAMPAEIADAVSGMLGRMGAETVVAVRSSAPGEDSAHRSFAGLHESVVGVGGPEQVLDAMRVVWASLWSDAALLYRQELSLDPTMSRMAVVVQELASEDCSGVAFGRDPREPELEHAVIEAVPGLCSNLVDGIVDPDRWILCRRTGDVLHWRRGEREESTHPPRLLEKPDLLRLLDALLRGEALLGAAADMEWTGRGDRLSILQLRAVTTLQPASNDKRDWYLSLRPKRARLAALRKRIVEELIPQLQNLGEQLALEDLEKLDDTQLSAAIQSRLAALAGWKKTYWDEFIPFAHGVRQLGTFYNDMIHPVDPYEFVDLLGNQDMLAQHRNEKMDRLAHIIRSDHAVREAVTRYLGEPGTDLYVLLAPSPAGSEFLLILEGLRAGVMDIAIGGERLAGRIDLILPTLLELALRQETVAEAGRPVARRRISTGDAEAYFLSNVGESRKEEAREILETARISWKLRDDDNLLIGRLESQLLRAVAAGAARLAAAGMLATGAVPGAEAAETIAGALLCKDGRQVRLPEPDPIHAGEGLAPGERPRQLTGQPAAPGIATGAARLIQGPADMAQFRAGEVLVCDSIQPSISHLVPLAAAIVERRGGMLIHGAIIARELRIPCVNGVPNATGLLRNGDLLTVDGYLGIVTVGKPEFDLERLL